MGMRLTILAVTKSYDGFCIAGMNENGEWVRPISVNSPGRFWTRKELTLQSGVFTQAGDVWEIEGGAPDKFEHPNHTEDFLVSKRTYVGQLSHPQLLEFMEKHCEGGQALQQVFQARGRSLCLVDANSFEAYNTNYDNKPRARMIFRSPRLNLLNPRTNNGNIIVKDCRWERLILNGTAVPAAYSKIYVCIGLAIPTPYDGVEYPQVVGLQTFPHVNPLPTYPD